MSSVKFDRRARDKHLTDIITKMILLVLVSLFGCGIAIVHQGTQIEMVYSYLQEFARDMRDSHVRLEDNVADMYRHELHKKGKERNEN